MTRTRSSASTSARGYGTRHQRARADWAKQVAGGGVECAAERCLAPSRIIHPDEPWDLGHDAARTSWTGPEHRHCNRSDGAQRGNAQRGHDDLLRGHRVSRDW